MIRGLAYQNQDFITVQNLPPESFTSGEPGTRYYYYRLIFAGSPRWKWRGFLHKFRDEISTVRIPLRSQTQWEFKPERAKTMITLLCFACAGVINHFVLAVVSDIISRDPLPDLAHSLFAQNDTMRYLADVFTAAGVTVTVFVCCVFHKHRWIVSRRLLYIGSVLYIMRAISICLTHIPSSYEHEKHQLCVPPNPDPNPTLSSVFSNFFTIAVTFGMQTAENKLYCGDMLFSGHTTAISTSCFFLNYYTPHSLWPLKWVALRL
ncbi:unnamed protein product [Nippostrongylus brasiliensis]|uniref:PAP2_C domain-containing protein n=1 Tax=Nippostrongylus brasiliensis TaxID=27835 RepID=A0A0N4XHE8_NIPBR|nr:unnamed protein product [Nippostrongylus brasiliensis]